MTARSRTAGVSRGSVPDLRRVDVQRHSAVRLTSAHHHPSVDESITPLPVTTATGTTATEADSHQPTQKSDQQLQTSHNGDVTNQDRDDELQQQTSATVATSSVKLDDVFNITQHVPVSRLPLIMSSSLSKPDTGTFVNSVETNKHLQKIFTIG